jgi:hypothetical protein
MYARVIIFYTVLSFPSLQESPFVHKAAAFTCKSFVIYWKKSIFFGSRIDKKIFVFGNQGVVAAFSIGNLQKSASWI